MIFNILLKSLDIIINNDGDNGSHCLMPCVEENNPIGIPLKRTKKKDTKIQALIHLHHLITNPKNFLRTLKRKEKLS